LRTVCATVLLTVPVLPNAVRAPMETLDVEVFAARTTQHGAPYARKLETENQVSGLRLLGRPKVAASACSESMRNALADRAPAEHAGGGAGRRRCSGNDEIEVELANLNTGRDLIAHASDLR